jgi:hypothetical protein
VHLAFSDLVFRNCVHKRRQVSHARLPLLTGPSRIAIGQDTAVNCNSLIPKVNLDHLDAAA